MDDSPSRDPRYVSLDLWRGVACLMVVLHHAGFAVMDGGSPGEGPDAWARGLVLTILRRMNLGVPLFFVISGYCILASADGHRRAGRSSWRFLLRRVWRIYPPYWASIAWFLAFTITLPAMGLARWLTPPYALEVFTPDELNRAQWLGNLTLTETWRPHVGGGPSFVWTRVAWSLCYEEQFYLVCFAVLLFARRSLHRTLAVLSIAFGVVRTVGADVGAIHRIEGTFPILWHEFALGLIVYWRLVVVRTADWKRVCEASLVGLLVLGLFWPPRDVPVEYSLAAASAFAIVLIPLRDVDGWLFSRVWMAPLRACGRRCYSIYLAHLPVCTVMNRVLWELGVQSFWGRCLVTVPVSAGVAVAACFGFYWVVEKHFLNPPVGRRVSEALSGEPEPGGLTG